MRYSIFDLTLDSDLELLELPSAAGRMPDLWLCRDPEPGLADAAAALHGFRGNVGDTWLRIGRLGDGFSLRFGESLTVRYRSPRLFWSGGEELGDALVRHTVLDQLLPLAAAHEGRTVLHAACVVHDGRARLLLAPTGSGKSTLAAALLKFGMSAAADDAASIEANGSTVSVQPAYYGLRLWPDTTEALSLEPGAEVADGCGKRRVPSPHASIRTLPLDAAYLLRPASSQARPFVRSLSARESLMSLVENTFVLDIESRAHAVAHLDRLIGLVAHVPVREFVVPRDLSRLDEVCATFMKDVVAVCS